MRSKCRRAHKKKGAGKLPAPYLLVLSGVPGIPPKGFIREGRGRRNLPGILSNLFFKEFNGPLQLGIFSVEGGMGKVVHFYIRFKSMPLDQPFSVFPVDAHHGCTGNAPVTEAVHPAEPDLASPGAHPDSGSEPQFLKTIGKGLPVRIGVFIDQHHKVPPEGVLHIPGGFPASGGPVHPGFSKQLFQDEAVDVAPKIIPNVYDKTRPVKNRVEFPVELTYVLRAHRPDVQISQLFVSGLLNFQPIGIFPVPVA